MKKLFVIFLLAILSSFLPSHAAGEEYVKTYDAADTSGSAYRKNEIIVKYRESRRPMFEAGIQARSGFSTLKTYSRTGISRIRIDGDMDIQEALSIYRNDPEVEYAEPNYRFRIAEVPNDPYFEKQWALENTGQTVNNTSGIIGFDIDAVRAWEITTGSSDIIVAVIDTGVDYNHSDLAPNMWKNPGEIENGIDSDGNGKIDDIYGWDFVDNNNDPMDYHDHGTHVAGIIAAVGNNKTGVAGVAWSAKIMALRAFDAAGYGYTSDIIEAIEYATDKSAGIINMSWGGQNYSQALKETIAASSAIFICAAGNERNNIDERPDYPSSYNLPNIISVAATDQRGSFASYSNYGVQSVDITAPGTNIYSTATARDTIWSENFDDGTMDGWTTGGTNNNWAVEYNNSSSSYTLVNSPQVYLSNTDSWALSPMFNLSGRRGSSLEFQITGISEEDRDFLFVQISSDGEEWITHEVIDGSTGNRWVSYTIDLKKHEGSGTVYLRFRFVSDEENNFSGFTIKNISVSAHSQVLNGDNYSFKSGTSMAAPFVSGTAALIKAIAPERSSSEIKSAILDGSDYSRGLKDRVSTSGRLNSYNALLLALNTCRKVNLILPDSFTSSDGYLKDSGEVSVLSPVDEDLEIYLFSGDRSKIILPVSVIIPAGQTSTLFDIAVPANSMVSGSMAVDVTYRIPGCIMNTAEVMVYAQRFKDGPVNLDIPETAYWGDGILENQGIVYTNKISSEDTILYLSSDNPEKVTVPESAIIAAGHNSVKFDIKIIDDKISLKTHPVIITAWTEKDASDSAAIVILDDDNISWIDETLSTNLTAIIRDNIRDAVYLGDSDAGQLVVIDSLTLEVILRLDIDSTFSDITISKDNSTMAVAGGNLYLVDLETFTKRKLQTGFDVFSSDFDHKGNILFSLSGESGHIHYYDIEREEIVNSFGLGSALSTDIRADSLVRTSADGKTFYVSSSRASKFDISGEVPVHLDISNRNWNNNFVLFPRYDEVYTIHSSSNRIRIVNNIRFDFTDTEHNALHLGLADDPNGYYLYGFTGTLNNASLFQFDISKRDHVFNYNLHKYVPDGRPFPRGISIDRLGKRAFIIHGDISYRNRNAKIQVVELYNRLDISLPQSAVDDDGLISNQGFVTALKDPAESLVIFLESDNESKVQVPDSVIIPAGQMSSAFDITIIDKDILDGTKSVKITAHATGFPSSTAIIDVHDNKTAELTLEIPSVVAEGDGLLADAGRVTVDRPVDDDVTVTLRADIMGEIVFPRHVIIPAGETSTTFDLHVIDDNKFQGDRDIIITAHVEGWAGYSKTLLVIDNDVADLKLIIDSTFSKDDGTIPDAGLVTISSKFTYDLAVNLTSSDESVIKVPSSVIIPAGRTSVLFDVTVMNNTEASGTKYVTITADAELFESSKVDMAVTDNDNIHWIDETESESLTYILRDDTRDVIYLADAGNSELVVIDSISLEVIRRLEIDSTFTDMSISKDAGTMAVAGGSLFLVDLEMFTKKELPIDLDVVSADFDHNGNLMLSTSDSLGYIHHYDVNREEVVRAFGTGSNLVDTIYMNALVRTDAGGEFLYVGIRGLSPASIHKFDISGEYPLYLARNNHGDVGSNLQDFVLSSRYDEMYVAGGSPYGIQIVKSDDISFDQLLKTGNTRHIGVASNPDGKYIYGLSDVTLNRLYQFDASSREETFHYNLQLKERHGPVSRWIAVDRHGKRAFIINGNSHIPNSSFQIEVVELEKLPLVFDQTITTEENIPVDITLQVIDRSGNDLDFHIVDQVENGILTGDGPVFTYTPFTGYYGPDSFTFKVDNGLDESNTATVTIEVEYVNKPPVAEGGYYRVLKNSSLDILLTAHDPEGDDLIFEIETGPSHGSLSGTAPNLIYTPNEDYHGEDSFTFRAYDGLNYSNVSKVEIDLLAKVPPGDINGDLWADLKDAILALRIASGVSVGHIDIHMDADVNGDGRIGAPEAVYILRKIAEFD